MNAVSTISTGTSSCTPSFSGLRDSTAYTFDEATGHTGGFALSDDGMYAAFGMETGSDSRMLLLDLIHRTTTELSAQHVEIGDPMFRPRRAQVLYRRDGALWLVDFTGKNNRKLKTAEGGELGPARWSPTGRTVYYLHFPGGRELNTLREHTPDDNTDKLISKTSQFVQFGSKRGWVGIRRLQSQSGIALRCSCCSGPPAAS